MITNPVRSLDPKETRGSAKLFENKNAMVVSAGKKHADLADGGDLTDESDAATPVADGLADGALKVKDGSLKDAHRHVADGPLLDGPDADGHAAEESRCYLASA